VAKLRISEIFTSVQGEGQWIGVPSVFVRVSGCNLRCVWCDTPYASWHPEGPVREVDDVVAEVQAQGVRHVVVTGGEPMLFEPTVDLVNALQAAGHVITIETAGTVDLPLTPQLFSISPKLSHSAPEGEWHDRHEAARWRPEVIAAMMQRAPVQFKFVVNPDHPSAGPAPAGGAGFGVPDGRGAGYRRAPRPGAPPGARSDPARLAYRSTSAD